VATRGTSLVVQPFIKPDTLDVLLRSLLRCSRKESVRLVFFSDNPSGLAQATHPRSAGKEHEFLEKNRRVMELVHEFREAHRSDFGDVVVHMSDRHLGPCGTCRAAIDFAFEFHDLVILTEDDALFSEDAIEWYERMHESGIMEVPENWAVTGESIYFDAKTRRPPPEYIEKARAACIRRGYFHQHTRFRHLPATSFAVVKPKWDLFRELRGQDRGDEIVCKVLKERKNFVVFPIVARVTNVGMLHTDGYSWPSSEPRRSRPAAQHVLARGNVIAAVDRAPFVRFTGDWSTPQRGVKLLGSDGSVNSLNSASPGRGHHGADTTAHDEARHGSSRSSARAWREVRYHEHLEGVTYRLSHGCRDRARFQPRRPKRDARIRRVGLRAFVDVVAVSLSTNRRPSGRRSGLRERTVQGRYAGTDAPALPASWARARTARAA
jgi:hypothetical protein